MKKKIIIISIILSFFVVDATVNYYKQESSNELEGDGEIRAIYISYLEYLNNFYSKSKSFNQRTIDQMIDVIKENNFNTIILHVSPFSDSIYHSKLFPFSTTLTGKEGKNPGFDFLEYFINKSHNKNIKLFAWINPYRISFDSNLDSISENNPARNFIGTTNIMIDKKGIYYNPASQMVQNLIVRQVEEIIDNYNIDGIHLDDYFYIQEDIDKEEYNNYLINHPNVSLKDFRLLNTNNLVSKIYMTIKKKNKKILFSIAPDGNINNNYIYHYADVRTWLSNYGYVDIIMPQIYYGFENEYSPFEKTLNNWLSLVSNKDIKIVPVLAYYKLGEVDNEAGKGKNEWIDNLDIIDRQINIIHQNNLNGYALFRYDYFVKLNKNS